jgi:hypothetical protein
MFFRVKVSRLGVSEPLLPLTPYLEPLTAPQVLHRTFRCSSRTPPRRGQEAAPFGKSEIRISKSETKRRTAAPFGKSELEFRVCPGCFPRSGKKGRDLPSLGSTNHDSRSTINEFFFPVSNFDIRVSDLSRPFFRAAEKKGRDLTVPAQASGESGRVRSCTLRRWRP